MTDRPIIFSAPSEAVANYKPTTGRYRRPHRTKAEVADIRTRLSRGESHSRIAVAVNVTIAIVSRVRNGRTDYGR